MYHADIECNLRSLYSKLDYTFRTYIPPLNPSTPCTHTLHSQYCQHSPIKPHTTSLRTPITNLRLELYTASLGGVVAHAPAVNY